jgi:DNA-binding MarR family transcriptional regulator
VNEDQPTRRPIGWWLKEADARLERAFDAAFLAAGRTRREWQVLNTLSDRPTSTEDLVGALAPFASRNDILSVVDALMARGEVRLTDGTLRVTEDGARAHAELASSVAQVRERVTAALPGDDYGTLVRLLARLVEGLPDQGPHDAGASRPRT